MGDDATRENERRKRDMNTNWNRNSIKRRRI